jgi:hypothetical protein
VISEAKFFAIVFQGNSRPAAAGQKSNAMSCSQHSEQVYRARAHSIAGMRSVPRKNTGTKEHDTQSTAQQRNNRTSKKKSPAEPGFFDEYLFQSVHFASLAI